MKITTLLIACMLLIGIGEAEAQYGKKKKKKKKSDDSEYFDESGSFAHKIWYGGGFTLGFSGNSNTSVFNIGISPMVGYKISEMFSIGPRAILSYTTLKVSQNDPRDLSIARVFRGNLVSYGGGVFARLKPFQSIFFHTEFELLNEPFLYADEIYPFLYSVKETGNKLNTIRQTSNNYYIGAGYHSGGGAGGIGYEVLLLYNILEPEDSVNLPIDLRFGFTWNF